jgi:lysozyme family protein
MKRIRLTKQLRNEYQHLFDTCIIRESKRSRVKTQADAIISNRVRYEAVTRMIGGHEIPWFVIGLIHSMESSLRFDRHLHNGDPLRKRTLHHPPGRPKAGIPPFTWEESAADALTYQGLHRWKDWSLPGILYKLEGYNGWGYRLYHPQVPSPYLWSFSNHYTQGKYVADGTWSDTAVSHQCGAAVILKYSIFLENTDCTST